MRNSHKFTPAVVDSLDTRCVPAMIGFHAITPALALPHAVVSVPVVHPPGTFSQGDLPPFFTSPSGERFTTNAMIATHTTTTTVATPKAVVAKPTVAVTPAAATPAAVVRPSAVVTPPPVVHLPGTFSQGDLPPFFTSPSGERFTTNLKRF